MFLQSLISSVALNAFLKVFTFALTTVQTRQLTPEQSGVLFTYNVYVETVMFLSREAVRSVSSRIPVKTIKAAEDTDPKEEEKDKSPYSEASIRKVIYLGTFCIGLCLGAVVVLELLDRLGLQKLPSLSRCAREVQASGATPSSLPESIVALSVLLLSLVEPCMLLTLSQPELFKTIVLSEFLELVGRQLVTVVGIRRVGGPAADAYFFRLVFAMAQLVYSGIHTQFFLLIFTGVRWLRPLGDITELKRMRDTVMTTTASSSASFLPFPLCLYSIKETIAVVGELWGILRRFLEESVLRLIMTEAEHFALTSMGSTAARGTYQVIGQLGTIVARLVYRVWETACFSRWSALIAVGECREAVLLLQRMLKLSFYFSFALLLVGPPLAGQVLRVLYTSRWAAPEMVEVFQLYFYVIVLLGVSGLLGEFLRAAASPALVGRLRQGMLVLTVFNLAGCFFIVYYFTTQTVIALVWFNIVNISLRSVLYAYLITQCEVKERGMEGDKVSVTHVGPMASLRDLVAWVEPKAAPVLAVLFAVSRTVPPRLSYLTVLGVVYVLSVGLLDSEIRQLLRQVWSVVQQKRRKKKVS